MATTFSNNNLITIQMERTVTVWESSKQKKTVFTSNAETLGELKSEMQAHDINLTNMSILEGVSHTQLLSDESVLPHDIPYKGERTNNLMIYLTLQNKKVSSGIDRKEIGAWIKENNLSDALFAEFHNNWTRVSTDNLIKFYNEHKGAAPAALKAEEEKPAETPETPETHKDETPANSGLIKWAKRVTRILYEEDIIDGYRNVELNALLDGDNSDDEGGFSMGEIDTMIGGFSK
jgi:hypothetical protein